jgi:CheY-like chemotaxis protein
MAKVLVVDDDPALLELLVEVVAEAGHEVRQATNGRLALAVARQEPLDLIISDIMMPLMTGTELLAALRADATLADLPVVLISAGAPPPGDGRPEITVYLRKPFDLSVVEDLIIRLTLPASELRE